MAWTDMLTRKKPEPQAEAASNQPIRLIGAELEARLRQAFKENSGAAQKIDALVEVDLSDAEMAPIHINKAVPAIYKLFKDEMAMHTSALFDLSGEGVRRATLIHQTLADHLPKLQQEFTTEINKSLHENGVEAQFYPDDLGGSKGVNR